MRQINRSMFVAGTFALTLLASACGSDGTTTGTSSSSSAASSSSPAVSSSAIPSSEQRQATPTPGLTTPHPNQTTPRTTTPVRDDDPGGQPCTDQNGAPGHYIDANGQWICQVTGDAPR